MRNKYILIVAVILLILAIAGGGFLAWTMRSGAPAVEPSPTPVASALTEPAVTPALEEMAPVEEVQTKSDLEQIKEAFAAKYNKPLGDITVTIDENTGTYANGGVKFEGEIGGAWWLAYNDGTGWIIVADGNGSVLCADIEGYNFPTSMVPECWDEATSKLIQRS